MLAPLALKGLLDPRDRLDKVFKDLLDLLDRLEHKAPLDLLGLLV